MTVDDRAKGHARSLLARKVPSAAPTYGLFLHASSVATKRGALLFLGHSTSGKSTISRMLSHDCAVIADDTVFARRRTGGDGSWEVGDGEFRHRGQSPPLWDSRLLRDAERIDFTPVAAVMRLWKDAELRISPIDELTTCRYLMDAALELDIQRYTWDERNARLWYGLVATMARSVPGFDLHFDRGAATIKTILDWAEPTLTSAVAQKGD